MIWIFRGLIFGLFATAFALRFWDLSLKPIHFDESINGWFVMQLWSSGFYNYDHNNYHGPLLFYILQLSEVIWGFGIEALRFVPVFFSFLTLLLVYYYRGLFGRFWWLVVLLFAYSPAQVFYARYAIHESVFVFFSVIAYLSLLSWWQDRRSADLVRLVYGLTAVVCLKETFALALVSGGCAWLVSAPLKGWSFRLGLNNEERGHLFSHIFVCFVIWLVMFSGFGNDRLGLVDFFLAFVPWAKTGLEGAGHQKAFTYWIELMLNVDWATLAVLVLTPAFAFAKSFVVRFSAVFALVHLLVYSMIPYKTPWCFIAIQWPFFVFLGTLANFSDLVRPGWQRIVNVNRIVWSLVSFFLLLSGGMIYRSYQLNLVDPADFAHPYVYVQGSHDVTLLMDHLAVFEEMNPESLNQHIQLGIDEDWPFPYLFHRYPHLSLFSVRDRLSTINSLIFIEKKDQFYLESRLTSPFLRTEFMVRDARQSIFVYFAKDDYGSFLTFPYTEVGPKEGPP